MGNVVIVTGASRGIGAAIAQSFADERWTVVLAARDVEGLERTAKLIQDARGEAVVVPGDISKETDRETLVASAEAQGQIAVLVNNAGIEVPIDFVQQSSEEIGRQLSVNLHAPLLLTRRVLPGMIARKQGVIVMISSMSGKASTPYNSVYAATKHGINGFVSSLRFELEGSGVQAGVVCPSFVADVGMWADNGVKAPAMMREVPVENVVDAVKRVLRGEREVLVTPYPVRPMLAISELSQSLGPQMIRALGVVDALKKRAEVVKARHRQ